MKDDVERLFGLQAPEDSETTDNNPTAAPVLRLPIFRAGSVVYYQGRRCTVQHVVIRRGLLRVQLKEVDMPVEAHLLEAEPTVFALRRRGPAP